MLCARAFSRADLLAAVAVCALGFIYLTAVIGCGGGDKDGKDKDSKVGEDPKKAAATLSPAQRQARQAQNSTHLRGIHSGMILFANGNKDFFPGLDSNGAVTTIPVDANASAAGKTYGFGTPDGRLVAYRLAVLLRGNYFSAEYMISPAETNPGIKLPQLGVNFADGAAYSYAMLNIDAKDAPRNGEWKATNNSRAAIVCDRNIGNGATGAAAQSVHTQPGEGWRGSVCYNDNYANFQTTDVIKTEYALKGEVGADQLFADTDKSNTGALNADAAMVFKAGNSYVNQQP